MYKEIYYELEKLCKICDNLNVKLNNEILLTDVFTECEKKNLEEMLNNDVIKNYNIVLIKKIGEINLQINKYTQCLDKYLEGGENLRKKIIKNTLLIKNEDMILYFDTLQDILKTFEIKEVIFENIVFHNYYDEPCFRMTDFIPIDIEKIVFKKCYINDCSSHFRNIGYLNIN